MQNIEYGKVPSCHDTWSFEGGIRDEYDLSNHTLHRLPEGIANPITTNSKASALETTKIQE